MSGFVISLEPPTKKQLKAQAARKAKDDAAEAERKASMDAFRSGTDHGDLDARAMNHEHTMARMHAGSAIDHAVECGKLLLAKKEKMTHGEFMPWIEKHCKFKYSTAARYMTAARQSSTGVEISVRKHLSYLFPSGRPEVKAAKKAAKKTAGNPAISTATTIKATVVEIPKSPLPEVAGVVPIASPEPSQEVAISEEAEVPEEKEVEVPEEVKALAISNCFEEAPTSNIDAFQSWQRARTTGVTGADRVADLERVKSIITEYAKAYGSGAAQMDLIAFIEGLS